MGFDAAALGAGGNAYRASRALEPKAQTEADEREATFRRNVYWMLTGLAGYVTCQSVRVDDVEMKNVTPPKRLRLT